jgi:hypothetical protein
MISCKERLEPERSTKGCWVIKIVLESKTYSLLDRRILFFFCLAFLVGFCLFSYAFFFILLYMLYTLLTIEKKSISHNDGQKFHRRFCHLRLIVVHVMHIVWTNVAYLAGLSSYFGFFPYWILSWRLICMTFVDVRSNDYIKENTVVLRRPTISETYRSYSSFSLLAEIPLFLLLRTLY